MTSTMCCVDQTRPGTKVIGGRWFCDEHYARAVFKRGGVWRAQLAAVLGLLVFVAALVGLEAVLKPQLTGALLMAVGVVLALVPAGLWLFVFYLQDRLEPEPVLDVARLFVVGLALAGAIGIPLTDQFFNVQSWLFRDSWTTALGSIFVIGLIEAFTVYAAVRFFIFDSPEFDERTDGVIYGTAAALGYATALNLQFILTTGGAALGSGEVYVVEVALAQAAFGGLLGYFLGRARLEQEPVWWLPGGLLLTALLNGLFNLARFQVDPGVIGLGTNEALPSFTGMLLAGGLALVVAGGVYALINRDIARSLAGANAATSGGDPTRGDRQSNWAVWGVALIGLLIGGLVWNNAVNRVTTFAAAGFRGAYPAYFGLATGPDDILRVVDSAGTGAEFSLAVRPGADEAQLIADELDAARGADYEAYRVLDSGSTRVNGRAAWAQHFAYVDGGALVGAVPEVRVGVDYIVPGASQAAVITLLTTPDHLAEAEPLFARFVNRLTLP